MAPKEQRGQRGAHGTFRLALGTLFLLLGVAAGAAGPAPELMNLTPEGVQGNGLCVYPAISDNGRYVAFQAASSNLVPNDLNASDDIFVRDRATGKTERVSVGNDDRRSRSGGYTPLISADGRYVCFESYATALVPGDTNGQPDVFFYDRSTRVLERISLSSTGQQLDSFSWLAGMSADGNSIAYFTNASNVVPNRPDRYPLLVIRNRREGTLRYYGDNTNYNLGMAHLPVFFTADGAKMLATESRNFQSQQSAAVIWNIATGARTEVGVDLAGSPIQNTVAMGISRDGTVVSYSTKEKVSATDAAGSLDVLVRDLSEPASQLVTRSYGGGFLSGINRVRQAPVSGNGQYVLFDSDNANLVPGDTNTFSDIFLFDRVNGTNRRVSVAADGSQGTGGQSGSPSLNHDASRIAFYSVASNLVPNDTNGQTDAFMLLASVLSPSLELVAVTPTEIRLSWSAPSGAATGYTVERRAGDEAFVALAEVGVSPRIYADTSFADATRYRYRIRAKGAAAASGYSNEVMVTSLPEAPTSLRELGHTDSAAVLAWDDNSTRESGYQVFRFTEATGWVLARTLPRNTVRLTDGGLPSNTKHTYYVRAIYPGVVSQNSNKLSVTTRPLAPTGFTAQAITANSIRLTWNAASPGVVSYNLQRRVSGGKWNLVATISAAGSVLREDTGLKPSTMYYYQVLAFGGGGTAPTGYVFAQTTTRPSAPTNLLPRTLSESAIALSWTDNSPDEIRFDLYRSEVGGADHVVASPPANSTTWTDTNLAPGTKYIYSLRAVNAGGSSASSNKISATTQAGNLQIPAPPTGLALAPASTSIQLTWADNSDGEDREDGFTLERDSGSGFTPLATLARNATSHNDTGLVTGRRYQYRIRAFNSVGASAYSNVAAATTGTNTVAEPSALVVETVSNTQLRLRWSDNSADETGFRIYRWSEAQPSFREIGTAAANATTFLDVDCTPDTKFTYYVVAVRGSAVSPGSNKASGRTSP